jgi:hypothetical protein
MAALRGRGRDVDTDENPRDTKRARIGETGDETHARLLASSDETHARLLASSDETELRQGLVLCTQDTYTEWSSAAVELLYTPCSYAVKYQVLDVLSQNVTILSAIDRRRVIDATCVLYRRIALSPTVIVCILRHAGQEHGDCVLKVINECLGDPYCDTPPNKTLVLAAFDLIDACKNNVKISDKIRWGVLLTMTRNEDDDDDESWMKRVLGVAQKLLRVCIPTHDPWSDKWTPSIVACLLPSISCRPQYNERRVLMANHLISFSRNGTRLPDEVQRPLLQVYADNLSSMRETLKMHCEKQMLLSPAFRSYVLTCPEMTRLMSQLTPFDAISIVAMRFEYATLDEACNIGIDQVMLVLPAPSSKPSSGVCEIALRACTHLSRLAEKLPNESTHRWLDFALPFVRWTSAGVYQHAALIAPIISTALARHVLTPAHVAILRERVLSLLEGEAKGFQFWLTCLLPVLMRQPGERDQDTEKTALRACSTVAPRALTDHRLAFVLPLVYEYLTHSSDQVCRAAFHVIESLRSSLSSFSASSLFRKPAPFATQENVNKLFHRAPSKFVDMCIKFKHAIPSEHHGLVTRPVLNLLQDTSVSLSSRMVSKMSLCLARVFNTRQLSQGSTIKEDTTDQLMSMSCGFVAALSRFPGSEYLQQRAITAVNIVCGKFKDIPSHLLHPCMQRLLAIPYIMQYMEDTVAAAADNPTSQVQLKAFASTDKGRLDLANILRNHIYGRVKRDEWTSMVRYHLGGAHGRPHLPPHIHIQPDWFPSRLSTLSQLVADAELAAQMAEDEEEDEEEEEEEDSEGD